MIPSVLYPLSYVASAAGVIFVTLSLASGLLWLAELIEENSKIAKTVGVRLIYTIVGLHVVLYFTDDLPLKLIGFSILCHLTYLQNFSSTWPLISLTSFSFLGSCIFVVADHFLWFFHFANKNQELRQRGGAYRPPYGHNPFVTQGHSFMEIASFFGICVWLMPLFLFLSLSANDNALPVTIGNGNAPRTPSATDFSHKPPKLSLLPRQSLAKSLFEPLFALLSFLRLRRRRKSDEGIIAPRSPSRNSPLMSPVPLTPTSMGLNFGDGHFSSYTNEGFRSPSARLSQPPPPRRVTTDAVGSSYQNSPGAPTQEGLLSPREGLRPRGSKDSRPSTPILANGFS